MNRVQADSRVRAVELFRERYRRRRRILLRPYDVHDDARFSCALHRLDTVSVKRCEIHMRMSVKVFHIAHHN